MLLLPVLVVAAVDVVISAADIDAGGSTVANGVTLETEAVLADLHHRHGGQLLRLDLAEATPLGRFRDWRAARPVVQWRGVK